MKHLALALVLAMLLSSLPAVSQSRTPIKVTTEVARLRAERDYLLDRVNQLEAERDQAQALSKQMAAEYERSRFTPVTVDGRTYETEQSFISLFDERADQYNHLVDWSRGLSAAASRPVIIHESIPTAPTVAPSRPIYCNTIATDWSGGGMAQTNCN